MEKKVKANSINPPQKYLLSGKMKKMGKGRGGGPSDHLFVV